MIRASLPAHRLGAEVHKPNPTFGTPGVDTAFWEGQQQLPDDCAIKCQQFVLEQFTGHAVAEGTLVSEAMEHGWYAPGRGTTPEDVGNLLELHGVGVTHYCMRVSFISPMELAQGHKVIVGVESDALWNHNPLLEALRDMLGVHGIADHAVVVSGIDTSDPQHVLVQVSDPGTGQPLAGYPWSSSWMPGAAAISSWSPPRIPRPPICRRWPTSITRPVTSPTLLASRTTNSWSTRIIQPYADVVHHYVEHDAAGQHALHDPAALRHHGEHAGHLPARSSVDVHHDLVTDPHHHDASHGDLDTAHHLADEHALTT